MNYKFLLFILVIIPYLLMSQPKNMGGAVKGEGIRGVKIGKIYGKVVDSESAEPLEFATVQIFSLKKDSLVGGGLVQSNGDFLVDALPIGKFKVVIKYTGYIDFVMQVGLFPPDKVEVDIGDITLKINQQIAGTVEVEAEKSTVMMSIDKRTYNVDKDISTKGGTAVDVMKNVSGVTVDADGNAQLRNQNPTIFVDGRPTMLALNQIPSDQIERIEIITNPSAKFDASATGGILNIIMKRNLLSGYNGMIMGGAGTWDRYNANTMLNIKERNWNLSTMYSFNQNVNDNDGSNNRTEFDINKNIKGGYVQNNIERTIRMHHNGSIGLDYYINNRNTISFVNSINTGDFTTSENQNFKRDSSTFFTYGFRNNFREVHYKNYNSKLMYKKLFPTAGKELTADLSYNYSKGENYYLFSTFKNISNSLNPLSFQNNYGGREEQQLVFQTDYVNPINDINKIEIGAKSVTKITESYNRTANTSILTEPFVRDGNLSNIYKITDIVNAAYVNYSSITIFTIAYQAGLRFEQSYYAGEILDKKLAFSYEYPTNSSNLLNALFPSLYFSKKMEGNQEVQLNFSRKIQRPNFFQLMPFIMFADNQNRRVGNPELKPEFKNIAELNYNKVFEKGNYLASLYFRYEEQPIVDVGYFSANPNESNILINTTVNGENGLRYGVENSYKYNITKFLEMNLNANTFYIYIKGVALPTLPAQVAEGYAFNAKANFTFKFPKDITLQVNSNYESERPVLLGYLNPVYAVDVSLNKNFGRILSLNLSLNDIFDVRRMGTTYNTASYSQYMARRREVRFVKFTAIWNFGKQDASLFKKNKQKGSQEGMEGGGF